MAISLDEVTYNWNVGDLYKADLKSSCMICGHNLSAISSHSPMIRGAMKLLDEAGWIDQDGDVYESVTVASMLKKAQSSA